MEEDYYYKAKGGRIPVKWTAPEAVLHKKYTTKSDVWSYGMVMYEIWSLGHKPFEEWDTFQVLCMCVHAAICLWLNGHVQGVNIVCFMLCFTGCSCLQRSWWLLPTSPTWVPQGSVCHHGPVLVSQSSSALEQYN